MGNTVNQPTEQPAPESSPTDFSIPTPTKILFPLVIAIIAAIALLSLTAAILSKYFYTPQHLPAPAKPISVPIMSPTATPVPTLTSSTDDWKIYSNKDLSFELSHPSSFIDWEEFGPSESLPRTISFHKGNYNSGFSLEGLYITVSDRSEHSQYYLDKDPVKKLDDYVNQIKEKENKVTIEEASLDNQRTLKIIYGDGKSMDLLYTEPDTYRSPIEFISFNKGKFYILEYHTENPELINTFNQILSTFTFLD